MGRNESSPEVNPVTPGPSTQHMLSLGAPTFLFSGQRKEDASVSRQPDPTPEVRIGQVAGDPGVSLRV